MSTKTSKVLHIIAFILIFLAAAFVIVGWLFLKDVLMSLMSASADLLKVDLVPWENIIEVGFVLFLALIWLIVLLAKPGRGATIAFTIIITVLLIAYYAVGYAFLNAYFNQEAAYDGAIALASYSTFKSVLSICSRFALAPGVVLMLLSMGGACGKSFKETARKAAPQQPVQQYGGQWQQPVQRPAAGAAAMGAAAYGSMQARPAQQAAPQWQNQSAMQNTGYIPNMQPVNQNTGYIPKTEPASQNTGYIPPVNEAFATGTLPKLDEYAEELPQTAEAAAAQAVPDPEPVIYPWQKQAGAPKAEDLGNNE